VNVYRISVMQGSTGVQGGDVWSLCRDIAQDMVDTKLKKQPHPSLVQPAIKVIEDFIVRLSRDQRHYTTCNLKCEIIMSDIMSDADYL
jgi:hypothetical protein